MHEGGVSVHTINLDHVVLEVVNPDQALAFYCDMLGMQPIRLEAFRRGQAPFPSVRAGTALIDLIPASSPGPGPHHLCVEVAEPMAEILKELARLGIATENPQMRFGARGLGQSLYVRDPDGHRVEIRTYAGLNGEDSPQESFPSMADPDRF